MRLGDPLVPATLQSGSQALIPGNPKPLRQGAVWTASTWKWPASLAGASAILFWRVG